MFQTSHHSQGGLLTDREQDGQLQITTRTCKRSARIATSCVLGMMGALLFAATVLSISGSGAGWGSEHMWSSTLGEGAHRILSSESDRIQHGDRVFLTQTASSGHRIEIEHDLAEARYTHRGVWQAFIIEKRGGGSIKSGDTVFLKAHTGAYLDVEGDTVRARFREKGTWQSLTIEKQGGGLIHVDDRVRFRAWTGKYIDSTGITVRASRSTALDWQSLRIEREDSHAIFSGTTLFLSTPTGLRLDVENEQVRAQWADQQSKWQRSLWQRIVISNYGGRGIYYGDTVFLQAHSGKFLDVGMSDIVQARLGDKDHGQRFTLERRTEGPAFGPIFPGDVVLLKAQNGKYVDVEKTHVKARRWVSGSLQSLIVEEAEERPDVITCNTSWHRSPYLGANLGGWLVAENWMWPSQMSDVVAEWNLINEKYDGPLGETARAVMREHWDNWVTEADLDKMVAFGISHLRIPIGHWLLDYRLEDGFVDGGLYYLNRLIKRMKRRCMKAVFELHALPGGQAPYESFTGKSVPEPYFWTRADQYARGKDVIFMLADLIRSYEHDAARSDVVVGMSPINEPSINYWAPGTAPGSQQDLYTSTIPVLRDPQGAHYLDASLYAIYLNYMGMASDMIHWLVQQPWARNHIVLDKHTYHKFDTKCDLPSAHGKGLQDVPHYFAHPDDAQCEWPVESDSCKTCCRDKWIIDPVVQAGFDLIVGEWSVATLTERPPTPRFRRNFYKQQLALFESSPGFQGSFFWSFKAEKPDMWKEWTLFSLIENDFENRSTIDMDLTLVSNCPKDLSHCPMFNDSKMENSLWKATCEWQDINCDKAVLPRPGQPEIQDADKITLVASNGKTVYVEGDIVRTRCASEGLYQELHVQKKDQSSPRLKHGDALYLKADAKTWDQKLYYLEADWAPEEPGRSHLLQATSVTVHPAGAQITAQELILERADGGGPVRSGDVVHLRTQAKGGKLVGSYFGDVVKVTNYDAGLHESFTILAI